MVPGPDVAIFSHYDRHGTIRPDSLRGIRELRAAGFSVLVVSNGGALKAEALALLEALGGQTIVRPNIGLDFGAWRAGLRNLGLPRPDTRRILLFNDSVYGPLMPLGPLLADMTEDGADLWGLTDSIERGWHLQSYFLLAHARLFRDAAWRDFWPGVVPLPLKRWTVGRYEIGLSRRVVGAGFRARALFPHDTIVPDGSVANPTLGGWHALLDAGFPFLKRELLRDNPTKVADLASWRDVVPPEYVTEIEADLRRR